MFNSDRTSWIPDRLIKKGKTNQNSQQVAGQNKYIPMYLIEYVHYWYKHLNRFVWVCLKISNRKSYCF